MMRHVAGIGLVLVTVACAGDPTAGVRFACDPDWKARGAIDPCRSGCRCERAPEGWELAGVCVCGAEGFDFGAQDPGGGADLPEAVEDVPVEVADIPEAVADVPEVVVDVPDPLDAAEVVCVPECDGRNCGTDGCGGTCGACGDGFSCSGGRCEVPCWVGACPAGYKGYDGCRCPVPSTGAQECSDGMGMTWCDKLFPGAEYYGQDAHFDGAPRWFKSNGDGTVQNSDTGLVWEATMSMDLMSYTAAWDGCQKNEGGHPGTGWHLPTAWELVTLVDYSRNCPMWDPVLGTNCGSSPTLWSSSVRSDSDVMFLDYEHGTLVGSIGTSPRRVRCVRATVDAEVPTGWSRMSADNDVATDRLTGLAWQRRTVADAADWKTALASCVALGDGWRLPTVNELASILVFESNECRAWPPHFGADCGLASAYWSSTVKPGLGTSAYVVDYAMRTVTTRSLFETDMAVRCVRTYEGTKEVSTQ